MIRLLSVWNIKCGLCRSRGVGGISRPEGSVEEKVIQADEEKFQMCRVRQKRLIKHMNEQTDARFRNERRSIYE